MDITRDFIILFIVFSLGFLIGAYAINSLFWVVDMVKKKSKRNRDIDKCIIKYQNLEERFLKNHEINNKLIEDLNRIEANIDKSLVDIRERIVEECEVLDDKIIELSEEISKPWEGEDCWAGKIEHRLNNIEDRTEVKE